MAESFHTVRCEVRHEPEKIKGSRHIATVIPLDAEDDIPLHLERVAAELPNARHHAYAWRLGRDRERFRSSDDGEPSGSAGKPILQQLDGRDLTNVLVVVTRYFGGTKLGVGGLVRAYGGACAEALDRAEVVQVTVTQRVIVVHDYELSSTVSSVLAGCEFEPVESEYAERVTLRFDVPESKVVAFVEELRERAADRVSIEVSPSAS